MNNADWRMLPTRVTFAALSVLALGAVAWLSTQNFETETGDMRDASDKSIESLLMSKVNKKFAFSSIFQSRWEFFCWDGVNSTSMPASLRAHITRDRRYQRYENSDTVWTLVMFNQDGKYDLIQFANISKPIVELIQDPCTPAARTEVEVAARSDRAIAVYDLFVSVTQQ